MWVQLINWLRFNCYDFLYNSWQTISTVKQWSALDNSTPSVSPINHEPLSHWRHKLLAVKMTRCFRFHCCMSLNTICDGFLAVQCAFTKQKQQQATLTLRILQSRYGVHTAKSTGASQCKHFTKLHSKANCCCNHVRMSDFLSHNCHLYSTRRWHSQLPAISLVLDQLKTNTYTLCLKKSSHLKTLCSCVKS